MALAKGTKLDPARAQMARDAFALARSVFNEWADMNAPNVPPNGVDSTQVLLARWENDRFGDVPRGDAIYALGIVEELAETFDAEDDAEEAVDGLGDICVYSAQICTRNRIALRPVLELAQLYCVTAQDRVGVSPIVAAGQLTHVVGKHEQRTRGLEADAAYGPALVDAIALVIAKAIEDCAMVHDLRIKVEGVFTAIGAEVMQRKAGDVMIPAAPWACSCGQKFQTIEALDFHTRAIGENGKPLGLLHGDPPPDLHHSQGVEVAAVIAAAAADRKAEAMASLERGAELLEKAAEAEPGDWDISDVIAKSGICPQCAASMSHDGSKPVYRCTNGHEFTAMQIAAMLPHMAPLPK